MRTAQEVENELSELEKLKDKTEIELSETADALDKEEKPHHEALRKVRKKYESTLESQRNEIRAAEHRISELKNELRRIEDSERAAGYDTEPNPENISAFFSSMTGSRHFGGEWKVKKPLDNGIVIVQNNTAWKDNNYFAMYKGNVIAWLAIKKAEHRGDWSTSHLWIEKNMNDSEKRYWNVTKMKQSNYSNNKYEVTKYGGFNDFVELLNKKDPEVMPVLDFSNKKMNELVRTLLW